MNQSAAKGEECGAETDGGEENGGRDDKGRAGGWNLVVLEVVVMAAKGKRSKAAAKGIEEEGGSGVSLGERREGGEGNQFTYVFR
jgi:hypothetical protein